MRASPIIAVRLNGMPLMYRYPPLTVTPVTAGLVTVAVGAGKATDADADGKLADVTGALRR